MSIPTYEQFENKIGKFFLLKNRFSSEDLIEILIMKDNKKIKEVQDFKEMIDREKEKTLKAYSDAKTDEEKKRVIKNVRKII